MSLSLRIAIKHIGSVILAALFIPPISSLDISLTMLFKQVRRLRNIHDIDNHVFFGIPYGLI